MSPEALRSGATGVCDVRECCWGGAGFIPSVGEPGLLGGIGYGSPWAWGSEDTGSGRAAGAGLGKRGRR